MRILFTSSALPSHFFPMAPLAWAARAAGHEVLLAVQPAMCDAVAASGLPTVPAGEPMNFGATYRASVPKGGTEDPKALFAQVAADMAADLIPFARGWRPDAVVWDPSCFAGPVAAAAVGVPSIRHLWGPDIVGRGGSSRERMPEAVAELCRAHGGDLDAVGWVTLDPCPPSLQVPPASPWRHIRYVPHSAAARVAPTELTRSGRPRVVITLGMAAASLESAHALLAPAVTSALASADVEMVVALAAGQAEALSASGPLPSSARVVVDCPLQVLLAGAAAVIHHGGAGTLLSAVGAGVPQLVLSVMPDLAFYGSRIAATGAGLWLRAADADEPRIREAANALLGDPAYACAAASLAEEALAQPTPADIAAELAASGGHLVATAANHPAPDATPPGSAAGQPAPSPPEENR